MIMGNKMKPYAHMLRTSVCFGVFAALMSLSPAPSAEASGKKVSSGQTQVVASVGSREITLNELRIEMMRLGLTSVDPNAERKALRSLTDRLLIIEEAKSQNMHKRPEALWRMEAAKDQALAEMYMGLISQAPEPTQADVETFVLDNPTLFTKAKRYTFSVLELSKDNFNLDEMTAYFDEKSDFSELQKYLDGKDIPYTLSTSVRTSSAFPEAIRLQLAEYNLDDNIVLNGDVQTSILKIINISNASITLSEGVPIARALIKQEEAQERVRRKLDSLRDNAAITVYRASARPLEAANAIASDVAEDGTR